MAGETILIIEDRRENIVHLANNVLKPSGYQVITAMDGQRGLRRILADKPDLVIMDLNMPKMDGLEVLAALQAQQAMIPVILTTFYGSEQVAEQALRLGAVDYVVKPYEVSEMLSAVRRALADRAPSPAPPAVEPEETMPLTRQVERWMRDMNILTRVGKALVALLDVDRVCSRTIEATIYITRAEHAFLILKEQDAAGTLCLRGARGPRDRQVRLLHQPIESGLVGRVVRAGEAQVQSRSTDEGGLAEIAGESLGPAIAVPLRWQRESVGALVAARSPGEAGFGESDAEWLTGLADYAAIAVRNAVLCQELRQQGPRPELDPKALAGWQRELDQLAETLSTAAEKVQHLAAQLTPEKQFDPDPRYAADG